MRILGQNSRSDRNCVSKSCELAIYSLPMMAINAVFVGSSLGFGTRPLTMLFINTQHAEVRAK